MPAGILTAQFSTQGDLGAAAIRYLTDSEISHVDLVVPKTMYAGGVVLKKDCLLGARLSGGVQQRKPDYAKFTRTVRLQVEVPDIDAALIFAAQQIGKPYNIGAIADFFLHRTRTYSPDQKSWFCDALLYAICAAGGVRLLGTDNPLNLTPQEVMLSPEWMAA